MFNWLAALSVNSVQAGLSYMGHRQINDKCFFAYNQIKPPTPINYIFNVRVTKCTFVESIQCRVQEGLENVQGEN